MALLDVQHECTDRNGAVDARHSPCLSTSHMDVLMMLQSPSNVSWPPQGLHLEVHFVAPASAPPEHKTIDLVIHYEMYVGYVDARMSGWMC
jgi:hypothetical protein